MTTMTSTITDRRGARRRSFAPAAITAAAALAVGGVLATPADAASRHDGASAPPAATITAGRHHDVVQAALDALITQDGFPGVLASVRTADGRVRDYTAGVGDLDTRRRVPTDGRVRIGSNTKTFTAVVVLQLVAEGKVDLEAPVETYLPGVVRGNGNDGGAITIHQLLQQTSGLPDYADVVFTTPQDPIDRSHDYLDPRSLVDAAMTRPPVFAPGTQWAYSNTNYALLGLVVERVAHRPLGEEITRRIIEPLGLRDTSWPQTGVQTIDGPHPHGYLAVEDGAPWVDVTEMDPSFGWAAGQLISSPDDLRRFLEAVVGGELLQPAQQAAMMTTVPAADFLPGDGWEYGLGIARRALPCGGYAWGHGGDIQGFETRNLVTQDGRGAVVAVTGSPTSLAMVTDVGDLVDAALCASAG